MRRRQNTSHKSFPFSSKSQFSFPAGGQLLEIRAAREFQEGQAHAPYEYLIGADRRRGRISVTAGRRNYVILVHAIAADADAAYQDSVLVKRDAARKNLNPVRQTGNRCTGNACPDNRGL